mmetsp:Transcript_30201/g.62738  ORF Transcript_30201/g.62738 Transcript_30201/m.62738 type:complete len:96 (+) Transcript_30201:205-492(+)
MSIPPAKVASSSAMVSTKIIVMVITTLRTNRLEKIRYSVESYQLPRRHLNQNSCHEEDTGWCAMALRQLPLTLRTSLKAIGTPAMVVMVLKRDDE